MDVSKYYPLKVVVCGFEQGGTTITKELLRTHPKLDSGFEGGFLLGNTPLDFKHKNPFPKMMMGSWQISKEELNKYIIKADNFPEAYRRLREKSKIITNKNLLLIDKTPRYMANLDKVLANLPGIPCIVVIRDPRGVCGSREKRGTSFERTCPHINNYIKGYRKALKKENNILTIQYEELCHNTEKVVRQMFEFIELPYNENWKKMNINTSRMDEYKNYLKPKECERILKLTKNWSEFHWNF